ncbi:MAG: tetratricopeptide repeat protein [Myxococcota bacterium]|nr:tetratricopeptide repeat protein [Myxococcota bacterium]
MSQSKFFIFFCAVLYLGCGGRPQPKLEEQQSRVDTSQQGDVKTASVPGVPTSAVQRLTADELRRLLGEARQSVNDGDLTSAEEKFKELILQAVTPTEDEVMVLAEARFNLAVLAEWQGDYTRAKRDYEASLTHAPELGDSVVAIGRIMIREGDEAGAVNYASGRLAAKPDSISLRNALNSLRIAIGRDIGRVEQDCKAILRKDETNLPAMINLAVVYARKGKHELAIAILNNANAIDESNPEVFWRLANSHLALQDKIDARLALEAAANLPQGGSAEVYNNLGLIYHEAGDYGNAEIQFRRALARWPDMLAARVNLGNALKGQQRYTEALTVFKQAEMIPGGRSTVAYNMGILLLDGQFPDQNPIERLNRSTALLQEYHKAEKDPKAKKLAQTYINEAKKRIIVEQKRAEQMRNSQKQPPPDSEPSDGDMESDEEAAGEMDGEMETGTDSDASGDGE